jgi:predicted membrane-bound dolichyl-phosphate-mannose-protein mannosyltransferase
MLDFDNSLSQPSILEILDPARPFWTRLSFSDHPPLVFLIQNLSMKIFGETNFGFRLPSAILGIASVYLLYLIGRRLFSGGVGLISAALFGLTVNHVYISRLGIQESYVIFFILLSFYLFLRALKEDKYFVWMGTAIGLGMLAKYTTFIVVPIFLIHLLMSRRDVFKNKKFWLGALVSLVIFSPVIIYNIMLYKNFGHFDFQLSYILGQNPEIWPVAKGKEEIGALADRLRNFIPNLIASNSRLFLAISALALIFIAWQKSRFLLIAIGFLALLMLFIGPTYRFLTMLTPFFALASGAMLRWAGEKFMPDKKIIVFIVLGLMLAFETVYSFNSQILNYPKGSECCYFSKVRYDNYSWGYNELENFLEKELKSKYPAIILNSPYQFIAELQNASAEKSARAGLERSSTLMIYDDNIHKAAQLWSLDRRQIYHGWPVLKTEDYLKIFAEKSVFKNHYFIIPTSNIPWRSDGQISDVGLHFEQTLLARGITPITLYNKRGEEVFRIYKF